MEDSMSVISSETESVTNISDEYVFVSQGNNTSNTSPSAVDDTLAKSTEPPQLGIANNGDINDLCKQLKEVLTDEECVNSKKMHTATGDSTLIVGNSTFYKTQTEKYNVDKSDVFEDVQQECTIFSGVCYLGAAAINAPKSEDEMQRNMAILNEQSSEEAIKVSISVPSSSQGVVVLHDAATQQVMARYEIHRIVYYARGVDGTFESSCFAFTLSHGDTRDTEIFQCHVFRCDIPEAVGQVSSCFVKAFQQPPSMTASEISSNEDFVFEVSLEVKEDDGRGVYTGVPRDRSSFKLKVGLDKILFLTVQQKSRNERMLGIERCFGVLLAPGRGVKHGDMRLLEMKFNDSYSNEGQICFISGHWDHQEPAFASLNVESSKTYITIAVDLVVRGIQEPVRFLIETPVKIFPNNTRFWYMSTRKLVQQFSLQLREKGNDTYEVLNIETTGELDRSRLNLGLSLVNFMRSPSLSSLEAYTPQGDESDNDEPLPSGTGTVSKDCTASELEVWTDVVTRWGKGESRPKQLNELVKDGVPEALRCAVWQRLADCENDRATMEAFPTLLTQECSCENLIQRDINRTFPGHDYFKDADGQGSLRRVIRAYAVYDTEVGYCQGLSFVAATLLLHMPEEQAFCVLVRMMYQYGLRELYKDGFENLYMRLYQLNRMLEEQLPTLMQHFNEHNVESHMFASQWFLTVFTARFPLHLVFHILDVFLLQGIDTLFQVALALLTVCKKDLMQLDFENILKYFRVTLPKKCRNKEVARAIMRHACAAKVKKLKKYEQEFIALKEAEDNADKFTNELETMKTALERSEEEKTRLETELSQVKAMLKREVDRAEADAKRSQDIISEYKKINLRLDDEQTSAKNRLIELRNQVSKCEDCRQRLKDVDSGAEQTKRLQQQYADEPQLPRALERIRELELELAQTKLERVQAECWKQELTHRLNSTMSELQTAKTSWISKTFTTIKDAAVNKKEGDLANGPDPEGGELMKKVFANRRSSKEKEGGAEPEGPKRSQTMETLKRFE